MNIGTRSSQTLGRAVKAINTPKLSGLLGIRGSTESDAQEEQEKRFLLESIMAARSEWESANINFEHAEEEGMVDYYIYQIKACQTRYEFLIKKAKDMGIRVEI